MFAVCCSRVTDSADHVSMHSTSLAGIHLRSRNRERASTYRPELSAFARTGNRAARLTTFLLETWSRLATRGVVTPRECATELAWVAENACALHGVRPSVRGVVPSKPCVIVANHISYFDPV